LTVIASHGTFFQMRGAETLRAFKDATSELHGQAEQFVRILDADASVADYVRYLRAMLGYHAPLEEIFAASPALASAGFDATVRRRAHLLEVDLRALGEDGPWERCAALPDGSSLPRLLGIAYVLEGSTLGGRFILSKLPPGIAGCRATAATFLAGYGPETGARWREFGAIVERVLTEPSDVADAIEAARETFARLCTWLARYEKRDAQRLKVAS
jgi:heme oxygenase